MPIIIVISKKSRSENTQDYNWTAILRKKQRVLNLKYLVPKFLVMKTEKKSTFVKITKTMGYIAKFPYLIVAIVDIRISEKKVYNYCIIQNRE